MSLIVRADFFYFIQFNLQLRISFYLLGKKGFNSSSKTPATH